MSRWVCPSCGKEDGDPDDGSYDNYEDLCDTIEFQHFICRHCEAEFTSPAPAERPESPAD